MQKKLSKELKIGFTIVIAIGLFVWGYSFLQGNSFFSQEKTFYGVYSQVNGLAEANVVLVNGYKVGKVESITFHPDGSGRLIVKYTVSNELEIPKNSIAKITSDLISSKTIEILLGDSKTFAKNGDTLSTDLQASLQKEVGILMLPIKTKLENLFISVDSVMALISNVFNDKTRDNLIKSFESIRFAIRNIENTTYNIDTLVTVQRTRLANILVNVESITQNFKNNNAKLSNIVTNFSTISDTLVRVNIAKTIHNTDKALADFATIMNKVNTGQGSLGLLINNDSLYKEVNSSSRELKLLLKDLRENPKRYVQVSVFGNKAKKDKKKK